MRKRRDYVWEGEEIITGTDLLNIHNLSLYDSACMHIQQKTIKLCVVSEMEEQIWPTAASYRARNN